MIVWFTLWIVAAVLFLAFDLIWLVWVGRSFYVDEIGGLLREQPDTLAAAAFYVLYVTGLVVMVLHPAHKAESVSQALIYGAMFGLFTYGTYDLTNLAVMKGFTLRIAMIDMAWGSILSALVSAATIASVSRFTQ
jgi:uncharacterized membrane protein